MPISRLETFQNSPHHGDHGGGNGGGAGGGRGPGDGTASEWLGHHWDVGGGREDRVLGFAQDRYALHLSQLPRSIRRPRGWGTTTRPPGPRQAAPLPVSTGGMRGSVERRRQIGLVQLLVGVGELRMSPP